MNNNTIEHLTASELKAYMKWNNRQQNGLSMIETAGEIIGGILFAVIAAAVIFA